MRLLACLSASLFLSPFIRSATPSSFFAPSFDYVVSLNFTFSSFPLSLYPLILVHHCCTTFVPFHHPCSLPLIMSFAGTLHTVLQQRHHGRICARTYLSTLSRQLYLDRFLFSYVHHLCSFPLIWWIFLLSVSPRFCLKQRTQLKNFYGS